MWIFVSSCVYAPMTRMRYPGRSAYWYLLVITCIASKAWMKLERVKSAAIHR